MYQAIREGDLSTIRDLISSGDYPDLNIPDEVGNVPAHLAVLFDRPAVLRLLHSLGVDLSRKCDPVNYGTPAFYAMHYGKVGLLTDLWEMGVDLSAPCDKFGLPPLYYAEKKGDEHTAKHLKSLLGRGTLHDVKATRIQKCARGMFARKRVKDLRQLRERKNYSQVSIGKVWRGGVTRMRMRKGTLKYPEKTKKETDAS